MKRLFQFRFILLIFVIFRSIDFLISYFATQIIPYLGFFPLKRDLYLYNLPHIISSFANFDGVHYILIAKYGYSMYEQAFFPLYPILIRLISFLGQNEVLSGLLISNLSFLVALYFIPKLLKEIKIPDDKIVWIILFLLVFPTSFFFNSLYTESLFLMFFVLSLYFYIKEQYLLALVFSFFISLTKLMGVFISGVFIFIKKEKLTIRFTPILAPILGLLIYSFYLFRTTGDPFFFINSQPFFGGNRSTSLVFFPQVIYRYVKILNTKDFNFQYFIASIELTLFVVILITLIFFSYYSIRQKNKVLTGINLFSLINLIIPTLTGTFQSVPRYVLISFGFFIALSYIKNNFIKALIVLIFIIFHVILLSFFSQGYFIS